MRGLATRCVPAFSFFSNGYQPFFFSFHSLRLLHLFIFSNSSTSFLSFSLQKFLLSLSFPHNLTSIFFFILNFSFKLFYLLQWHPSLAKVPTDILHLTRWNGAVRLKATPPLTYRSQQHNLEGARIGLVSFSNFPHFSSFPLIFCFNPFLCL